jgi:hypothetical protein
VRNVKAKRVRVDEIWSFAAAKNKNVSAMKNPVAGADDTGTWTAIEADTKLIISHFVDGRDGECAPRQRALRAATAPQNASERKDRIEGDPDMKHASPSYAKRANLTMRMHNRRFTRLTNAFSKKFGNHAHMVAIYAVWYNWIRIHKTLRVTPAMVAGLSETVMDWASIVEAMDADMRAPKRGPYKEVVAEISN